MRIFMELFSVLLSFLLILGFSIGVAILCWWIWRKITLQEGEPQPRLSDLKGVLVRIKSFGNSMILRMFVVGVLGLLMSLPLSFISSVISERTESYRFVVNELSYSWGGPQMLTGPALIIPYTIEYSISEKVPLSEKEIKALEEIGDHDTKTKTVTRLVSQEKTAVLLPEDLKIQGQIDPTTKKRGIYSTLVYTADLKLEGFFKRPDFSVLDERIKEVHWNKTTVLVGFTDTKAFRNISSLKIAGKEYQFEPGTRNSSILPTGFSAELNLAGDWLEAPFSFEMSASGSQGFYVAPVAVNTAINIKSSWAHPKYTGTGLPSRHETNLQGFDAYWNVPNLVRNYPQFANMDSYGSVKKANKYDYNYSEGTYLSGLKNSTALAEYVVGVDFFEPVFHYSIITRAVKYAMMFIGLTFLSVLVFEFYIYKRKNIKLHLAQYAIIGFALSLFYLVLLAAAEHMSFIYAYLLAGTLNVLMIGGYMKAALDGWKDAAVVAGLLAALYAILYFILNLEDYALAAGTALLVVGMAALMYCTRKLGQRKKDLITDK